MAKGTITAKIDDNIENYIISECEKTGLTKSCVVNNLLKRCMLLKISSEPELNELYENISLSSSESDFEKRMDELLEKKISEIADRRMPEIIEKMPESVKTKIDKIIKEKTHELQRKVDEAAIRIYGDKIEEISKTIKKIDINQKEVENRLKQSEEKLHNLKNQKINE